MDFCLKVIFTSEGSLDTSRTYEENMVKINVSTLRFNENVFATKK